VRYLCRGNPSATFEAGLNERLVVSEFPSLEKAIAGHDSPGYAEAMRALGDGAVRDIRIIEGLEGVAERRRQPPSPRKLVELVDRDRRRGCEADASRFRKRGRGGHRARIVRQVGNHYEIDAAKRRVSCLQLATMLLE